MWSTRMVWAVAVGMLLTSCVAEVSGTPSPARGVAAAPVEPEPEPLRSGEVLGDLKAIDFCSLVDEKRLERTGVEVEKESQFVGCEVTVRAASPASVSSVLVGDLIGDSSSGVGLPVDEEVDLPRDLRRRLFAEDAWCGHELVFADDIGVWVEAGGEPGKKPPQETLCRYAEAIMDGLQEAILAGSSVDRFDVGENSLTGVDACGLLTEEEGEGAVGEAVLVYPTVTSHSCSWWPLAYGSDSPLVTVDFMISSTDPSYRGSYPVETSAYTETIAGRPSFAFETEDGKCVVNAYHALLGGANKDRREIASLIAGAVAEDPCAVARKLAEQAWPRLPDLRE